MGHKILRTGAVLNYLYILKSLTMGILAGPQKNVVMTSPSQDSCCIHGQLLHFTWFGCRAKDCWYWCDWDSAGQPKKWKYGSKYKPDCWVCSDRSKGHRKQTRYFCATCNIPLCLEKSFEKFHTNKIILPDSFLSKYNKKIRGKWFVDRHAGLSDPD